MDTNEQGFLRVMITITSYLLDIIWTESHNK